MTQTDPTGLRVDAARKRTETADKQLAHEMEKAGTVLMDDIHDQPHVMRVLPAWTRESINEIASAVDKADAENKAAWTEYHAAWEAYSKAQERG